jgi:hypothetical protein
MFPLCTSVSSVVIRFLPTENTVVHGGQSTLFPRNAMLN